MAKGDLGKPVGDEAVSVGGGVLVDHRHRGSGVT
jgi:hypothetical protein